MKIASKLCILLTFVSNICIAQVDYNKIVLPNDITDSLNLGERLVQLAWNNHPENKILAENADIAQIEISKAKTAWLNNIRLSGNLNEYSTQRVLRGNDVNEDDEDQPVNNFFPIYNFGVTVPLGIFFENPKNTKIATHQYYKEQEMINARKLELRAEVLTRYQDFLMYKKLLEVQTSMTENQYAKYQLAEQQFQNNAITLEDYEEILQGYNTQRISDIQAERDFLNAKILLEELIGMKLEDIR